eukprot:symbB.v1.2.036190.t2/scaffold5050.1/size31463/2
MIDDELMRPDTVSQQAANLHRSQITDDELMCVVPATEVQSVDSADFEYSLQEAETPETPLTPEDSDEAPLRQDTLNERSQPSTTWKTSVQIPDKGDLVNLDEIKEQIAANFASKPISDKRKKNMKASPKGQREASRSQSRSPRQTASGSKTLPQPVSALSVFSDRPMSAHERLYQRSTRAHRRQAHLVRNSFANHVWHPKQVREDGPAAEACKRLHRGKQRKEEELVRIRDKYEREFAAVAPFSPRSDRGSSPVPRKQFQAWVNDQEQWKTKRDEKLAEKVKGRQEEEAKYLKEHSVHRELYETNPSKAVNRLYTSHLRSKEKLQKLRSEKIQQEMEHLQESSVHRHVVKTDASEKVQSSIHRLYHQDLKKRQKWLKEQVDAKLKADLEAEEQILRDSVHARSQVASPQVMEDQLSRDRVSEDNESSTVSNEQLHEAKDEKERNADSKETFQQKLHSAKHLASQSNDVGASSESGRSANEAEYTERQVHAAMKIQSVERGRQTRQRLLPQADGPGTESEGERSESVQDEDAGRHSQISRHSGQHGRWSGQRQQHESNDARASSESERSADEAEDTERQVHAAMKIQSVERGRQTRQRLLPQADGPGTESEGERSESVQDEDAGRHSQISRHSGQHGRWSGQRQGDDSHKG